MSLWVSRGSAAPGSGFSVGLFQVFLFSPWTSGTYSFHGEWQELKSQAEPRSTFKDAHDTPLTFHWLKKHHVSVFELWFPQGICPVVGLLGHMVVLFLVF